MGFLVVAVGVVLLGAVIVGVIVFAVTRNRRTTGNGNPAVGMYAQNMNHPPQQPVLPYTQQPYSNPTHNPYMQQTPYQGQ
ncbi:hypothetical protein [Streptomyces poonensis]|uniref:Uncharacterized protein n=1 Tax=Streptomyces poonensis TaxID=68255 RepID=A0A918UX43_9ACTN|nr:hypothetical protein [Streptomyces poonensis]GGZ39281.1 hypothetical protein GCM10010365_70050 [Streptomyces poonensis]GLJ93103.1 hypothetical protein GCM10017589_57150 [Streptomyces poonensis]